MKDVVFDRISSRRKGYSRLMGMEFWGEMMKMFWN